MATVLWILAILPMFTVLRRMRRAWILLHPNAAPPSAERFVPPWQQPRTTTAYALVCILIAGFILVGPWLAPVLRAGSDPLRLLLPGT